LIWQDETVAEEVGRNNSYDDRKDRSDLRVDFHRQIKMANAEDGLAFGVEWQNRMEIIIEVCGRDRRGSYIELKRRSKGGMH
jgi:hypothetical protein